MTKSRVAVLLCLSTSGCVPIPYPHDAYLHSNVSGQVRDGRTKEPVTGVKVRLAGETQTTDRNGAFAFTSSKKKKWVVAIPLLPFDPEWQCSDRLEIDGYRDVDREMRYRNTIIAVHSCKYSPLPGLNDYLKNPSLFDDIGSIDLLPRTFGPKP
jgi:hypothetical protein